MSNKGKTALVEISATVLSQTKDALEKIMKNTGMTMGEAIDRLSLQISPKDKDKAASLALDYVVICLSSLSKDEFTDAFFDLAATMGAFMSSKKLNSIRQRAIEKRVELANSFRQSLDEGSLKNAEDALEDGLSDEGKRLYENMLEEDEEHLRSNADLIDLAYSMEPLLQYYINLSLDEQEEFEQKLSQLFDALKNS